jgi:hypothetical protein
MPYSNGYLVFIQEVTYEICNDINDHSERALDTGSIQYATLVVSAFDPMAFHAVYALLTMITEADLRRLLHLPNNSAVSICDPTFMVNELAHNLIEYNTIGNIIGHTFEWSRNNPLIQYDEYEDTSSYSVESDSDPDFESESTIQYESDSNSDFESNNSIQFESDSDSDSDYDINDEAISVDSDTVISIPSSRSEVSYNEEQERATLAEILEDATNAQLRRYEENLRELDLIAGEVAEHEGEEDRCIWCQCNVVSDLHLVRQNYTCQYCGIIKLYHYPCLLIWIIQNEELPRCHLCNDLG